MLALTVSTRSSMQRRRSAGSPAVTRPAKTGGPPARRPVYLSRALALPQPCRLPSMTGQHLHTPDPGENLTRMLRSAAQGNEHDHERLITAIYDDLRRLAQSRLNAERANHTLQPTALVHEVYLRLIQQHSSEWTDRAHFFAFASEVIRRILIDHAREKRALKRGGTVRTVSLDGHDRAAGSRDIDLLALDEALRELHELSPRQSRIVEMRFFGGCTLEEIASLLDVGRRTVDREWLAAKTWLMCRLRESNADSEDDR